jgi:uroporphyrinogen-III synthase
LNGTLRGAAVLVTRPAAQAETLCALIERHGGVAVRMPLLEIEGLAGAGPPISAAERFAAHDWVIFISANAVNFALPANSGKMYDFGGVRFAAVGSATAKAMRERQLPVDVLPETGSNSEALLDTPEFRQVRGLSCLIVRGEGGRELLAETLRQRGARVAYWEVYRRVKPALDSEAFLGRLDKNLPKVLTVTSGEALRNLVEMCGGSLPEQWLSLPLAAFSERIGRMARLSGFKRIAVAADASDAAIIKTVTALLNGDECGRID